MTGTVTLPLVPTSSPWRDEPKPSVAEEDADEPLRFTLSSRVACGPLSRSLTACLARGKCLLPGHRVCRSLSRFRPGLTLALGVAIQRLVVRRRRRLPSLCESRQDRVGLQRWLHRARQECGNTRALAEPDQRSGSRTGPRAVSSRSINSKPSLDDQRPDVGAATSKP